MFRAVFAEDHRSLTAWDRFRREVLEYGGSRDEWSILQDFIGHTPEPTGLLQNLGIS